MKTLLENIIRRTVSLLFVFAALYLTQDYDFFKFIEELKVPLMVALASVGIAYIVSLTLKENMEKIKSEQEIEKLKELEEKQNLDKEVYESKKIYFKVNGIYLVTFIVIMLLASGLITVETYGKIIVFFEVLLLVFILSVSKAVKTKTE